MNIKMSSRKNIFFSKDLDLHPQLNNIKKINGDEVYEYTFYAGIDRRNYIKYKIENIEVAITPNISLKGMKSNALGKSIIKNTSFSIRDITKDLLVGKKTGAVQILQNLQIKRNTRNNFKANISSQVKGDITKGIENSDNILFGTDVGSKYIQKSNIDTRKTSIREKRVEVSKRYISIPIKYNVSKKQLKMLKCDNSFFIVNLIAKNKSGISLDSTSQKINHQLHTSFQNSFFDIGQVKFSVNNKNLNIDVGNIDLSNLIGVLNVQLESNDFKKVLEFPISKKITTVSIEKIKIDNISLKNNIKNNFNVRLTFVKNGTKISNFIQSPIKALFTLEKNDFNFYVLQEIKNTKIKNKIVIPYHSDFAKRNLLRIEALRKEYDLKGERIDLDFKKDNIISNYNGESKNNLILTDENPQIDRINEYKLVFYFAGKSSEENNKTFSIKNIEPENLVQIKVKKVNKSFINLRIKEDLGTLEKIIENTSLKSFEIFKEEIKKNKKSQFKNIAIDLYELNTEKCYERLISTYQFKRKDTDLPYIDVSIPANNLYTRKNSIYILRPKIQSFFETLAKENQSNKNLKNYNFRNAREKQEKINQAAKKNLVSTMSNSLFSKSFIKRNIIENNKILPMQDITSGYEETGDVLYINNFLKKDAIENTFESYYTKIRQKSFAKPTFKLSNDSTDHDLVFVKIKGQFNKNQSHVEIFYKYQEKEYFFSNSHIDKDDTYINTFGKCITSPGDKIFYFYVIDKNGNKSSKYTIRRL